MRRVIALALVACGGPGDAPVIDTPDGARVPDAAAADAVHGIDGGPVPDASADAAPGAPDGGAASRRILFQCDAFAGGLCAMDEDGGGRDPLHASGYAPRGLDDGTVLFHTAGYRVARRLPGGDVRDLGAGAFARRRPGGDLLFQCSGLDGGLCTMDLDGRNRAPLRATGRVPDVAGDGAVLFHSDGYRIIRRDPGGQEHDLGDGAFATWADDGGIVFQCSGLGGGLCRMDRDGRSRAPIVAGRVPDADAGGDLVFHTDDYRIAVRRGSSTTTLGAGANAVWWPAGQGFGGTAPTVRSSSAPSGP